eukprot:UN01761
MDYIIKWYNVYNKNIGIFNDVIIQQQQQGDSPNSNNNNNNNNIKQYKQELKTLNNAFAELPLQLNNILSKTVNNCNGIWKPEITFFGENLPEDFTLAAQLDKTGFFSCTTKT